MRIIFSSRTVQPKSACNLITWQKKHLFLQGSSQRQLLSRAEYAIYMIYMIQILCFNIYVDLFLMIFVCYQRNWQVFVNLLLGLFLFLKVNIFCSVNIYCFNLLVFRRRFSLIWQEILFIYIYYCCILLLM